MTLTTKEFQDLRDILFPGGRLGFVWVLLHSFFNHILQADLLEVMWYATGTASKLRKTYGFLILACRPTKGTPPPESKLFYTCKCWCICWSGFQSPGLRWGLCLCQAVQLALEQQCAELGAACSAGGAVSLCVLPSKPKGSIYWLRWVGKNYSDLLRQCLDLKVVIQSSAKPDTILLVLTVVSSVLHQVGRCNYSMVQRSRKGPHGSMCSMLSASRARHFLKEKWNSVCHAVLDQKYRSHCWAAESSCTFSSHPDVVPTVSFTISPSSRAPHTQGKKVAVNSCCWVLMLICAFILWQLRCVRWCVLGQQGFSPVGIKKSHFRYWPCWNRSCSLLSIPAAVGCPMRRYSGKPIGNVSGQSVAAPLLWWCTVQKTDKPCSMVPLQNCRWICAEMHFKVLILVKVYRCSFYLKRRQLT